MGQAPTRSKRFGSNPQPFLPARLGPRIRSAHGELEIAISWEVEWEINYLCLGCEQNNLPSIRLCISYTHSTRETTYLPRCSFRQTWYRESIGENSALLFHGAASSLWILKVHLEL